MSNEINLNETKIEEIKTEKTEAISKEIKSASIYPADTNDKRGLIITNDSVYEYDIDCLQRKKC